MIVLVHENHDKLPNVPPVQHFCSGFDHTNLVNSFLGSKYLLKICIFFEYEHLKGFVWKDDIIYVSLQQGTILLCY